MNQPGPLPPFALRYTPQVPELLQQLGGTLAISTYQAGKLILLSAPDEQKLIQLPRSFQKPMGIAEDPERDHLAIACKDSVITFASSTELAQHYPKAPDKYDAMYFPRMTYHTGALDIHDLNYGKDGKLYGVNTLFSCLVELDENYNFTPYWQPTFIDRLTSEDRCHLNGMAMEDGKPKYATSFSQTNTAKGWRPNVTTTGTIFDVESSEVLATGLAMPHSPKIYNSKLYVLLSATGELVEIDRQNGQKTVVTKVGGFVRGMALAGDYLFIGLSKLRKNSSTFAKLDFAEKANESGIVIVNLPTGATVGKINYLSSVDEIYDVHFLKGKRRPNILNTLTEDHQSALMIPSTTYWKKEP
jgi:uncharacterized protein (TIGR03032 family)